MSFVLDSKNWVDIASLFISFFSLIAGSFLAWYANKVAKSNFELARQQHKSLIQKINSEERDLFRANYNKICNALAIIFREDHVNDEAKNLFWQARDEARLELPNDIAEYTQGLFDKMWEAYMLHYNDIRGDNRLPKGAARSAVCQRHTDIISQLIYERPSSHYARHMKLHNK